jgi:transposase-like protein
MKRANMKNTNFKWKHYEAEIIITCVRWYLKYPLSYRNIEEMMEERNVEVDHTTIYRWVNKYSTEINKKMRKYLNKTNDSWRVDETYIKVKGKWTYLYRAVDSNGDTLDFMLSKKRNKKAATKFFKKVLKSVHNKTPRVITVDKNLAYPPAIDKLKEYGKLPEKTEVRKIKYLNNIVEQDHRAIKRITKPMMGFNSFVSASKTIQGIEAMNMIRKGQVSDNKSVLFEVKFINQLFGIAS